VGEYHVIENMFAIFAFFKVFSFGLVARRYF